MAAVEIRSCWRSWLRAWRLWQAPHWHKPQRNWALALTKDPQGQMPPYRAGPFFTPNHSDHVPMGSRRGGGGNSTGGGGEGVGGGGDSTGGGGGSTGGGGGRAGCAGPAGGCQGRQVFGSWQRMRTPVTRSTAGSGAGARSQAASMPRTSCPAAHLQATCRAAQALVGRWGRSRRGERAGRAARTARAGGKRAASSPWRLQAALWSALQGVAPRRGLTTTGPVPPTPRKLSR